MISIAVMIFGIISVTILNLGFLLEFVNGQSDINSYSAQSENNTQKANSKSKMTKVATYHRHVFE